MVSRWLRWIPVLLLLVQMTDANGYEVVSLSPLGVNPTDPWYNSASPQYSSRVSVQAIAYVRITTDVEVEHGGNITLQIIQQVGVDDVLEEVDVHFAKQAMDAVVACTTSVCLWFNSAGALTGHEGPSDKKDTYELVAKAKGTSVVSEPVEVTPVTSKTTDNYVTCDTSSYYEPSASAVPSVSTLGAILLVLLLILTGAGAAVVLYRRKTSGVA